MEESIMKNVFTYAALLALLLIVPASAATIWDFSNYGVGDVGAVTKSFNATSPAGLPAIVVTGPVHLYYKADGGDETGLGLVGTSDHEIGHGQTVTLNLSALAAAGYSNFRLTVGSVQSGEDFTIGGSASGTFGVSSDNVPILLLSGAIPLGATITITDSGTAPAGDVLIVSASADAPRGEERVPEPATFALAGSALSALFFLRRRVR
jgi:hypothetical protein